jgi:glycosyltransferase involved in cell wall biosynthesis
LTASGGPGKTPRIAVVIPCFDDGEFVREAVDSVRDDTETVELVVVDDASEDPATIAAVDGLSAEGVRVVRHERNRGLSAARMTGVRATGAPYVFPLDSDDLAYPGALSAMADRLDANPRLALAFGDYLEFGDRELVRAVPEKVDPYRIAYTNEYPGFALFRRVALERVGGWSAAGLYEDWDLWMTIAEEGLEAAPWDPGSRLSSAASIPTASAGGCEPSRGACTASCARGTPSSSPGSRPRGAART